MSIEIRQVCHPEAVRHFSAAELRRHFLIEELFVPDQIKLTYSHIDRLVVGGATPTSRPLKLKSDKQIGSPNFLDRRELGIVNLGGPGAFTRMGKSMIWAPAMPFMSRWGRSMCALNPSMETPPQNSILSALLRMRGLRP